jgi:hypothetical protein
MNRQAAKNAKVSLLFKAQMLIKAGKAVSEVGYYELYQTQPHFQAVL